jgi:hypothetical protein
MTKVTNLYYENQRLKGKIESLRRELNFSKQTDSQLDFPFSFFVGAFITWGLCYLKYSV